MVHFLDFVRPPDDSRTAEVWSPVRLSVIAANAGADGLTQNTWKGGDLFVDRRLSEKPVEGFVVAQPAGAPLKGLTDACSEECSADVTYPPEAPSPEGVDRNASPISSGASPPSGVDDESAEKAQFAQNSLSQINFDCTNQLACVGGSFEALDILRAEMDTTRMVLADSCEGDTVVWTAYNELLEMFNSIHGELCEYNEFYTETRIEADEMLRAVERVM